MDSTRGSELDKKAKTKIHGIKSKKGAKMSNHRKTKSETRVHLVYGTEKWQWQELEALSLQCVRVLSPSFNTPQEAQQWADEHMRRK